MVKNIEKNVNPIISIIYIYNPIISIIVLVIPIVLVMQSYP